MLGAVICYIIGRKNKTARNCTACFITVLEFAAAVFICTEGAVFRAESLFGLGLEFRSGGLRGILIVIAAFVWLMTTLFSNEYFKSYRNRNRYYFFMLLTLGATMGVFMSADFYTTLIFFEIMSFTSWVLVMHDETADAVYAGMTYLTVAIIGGLITLVGMFFLYHSAGTLNFEELSRFMASVPDRKEYYIYGIMVLVGFGAKAGAFPLHIWLPQAHPVAPAPASAILSCVLTKTGIFGVLALSTQVFFYDANWGMLILAIGTITMLLGAVLAVFSINLKRTLACSSLSQIGFILVGIGMQGLLGEHNSIASGGTILHIVNHSVIKMTLFLCAGAVYMNLHELNLNKIRGWGRDKPLLKVIFLWGLLGIGGIPLWGGYISKTLLHESIVEYIAHLTQYGHPTVLFNMIEWVFLISGGLTLAYMTKLFVAVFVEKNPYGEVKSHNAGPYMDNLSAAVLIVCAVLISVFGLMPHAVMDNIAYAARGFMNSPQPEHAVHYFAAVNLKGAVISVAIGAFVYFVIIRGFLMVSDEAGSRVYIDAWPEWANLEKRVYRPLILNVLPSIGKKAASAMNATVQVDRERIGRITDRGKKAVSAVDVSVYVDEWPKWLNIEKIVYRPVLLKILPVLGGWAAAVMNLSFEEVFKLLSRFAFRAVEIFSGLIENILLALLVGSVIAIRFFKSIFDYAMQLVLYFFFNYEDISYDGKRQFRKDAYFSRFSVDKHGEEQGARENLSISLMLFGVGVVLALIYLII